MPRKANSRNEFQDNEGTFFGFINRMSQTEGWLVDSNKPIALVKEIRWPVRRSHLSLEPRRILEFAVGVLSVLGEIHAAVFFFVLNANADESLGDQHDDDGGYR